MVMWQRRSHLSQLPSEATDYGVPEGRRTGLWPETGAMSYFVMNLESICENVMGGMLFGRTGVSIMNLNVLIQFIH